MKIGLLGGSFNPAHEGHLHISEIALNKLGLDQVWWLVSPQNPLKASKGMQPFKQRVKSALDISANNPLIRVSEIENRIGTRFTADTLKRLSVMYPRYKFFWLMGTDNLIQLPKWKKWEDIFKYADVHVFDRMGLAHKALKGPAAAKHKIIYHHIRNSPISSTKLRLTPKSD